MKLKNCTKNCRYKIQNVPNNSLLKGLGLRQEVCFKVKTIQPLKGPIVIEVKNRSIAIDSDIAKEIEVEEI